MIIYDCIDGSVTAHQSSCKMCNILGQDFKNAAQGNFFPKVNLHDKIEITSEDIVAFQKGPGHQGKDIV
jgi:hypothetical protein